MDEKELIEKFLAIKSADVALALLGDNLKKYKNGIDYKGQCPFDGLNEKQRYSPSFYINSKENLILCFRCGYGAGPVKFANDFVAGGDSAKLFEFLLQFTTLPKPEVEKYLSVQTKEKEPIHGRLLTKGDVLLETLLEEEGLRI